jgi:hypothetical protein
MVRIGEDGMYVVERRSLGGRTLVHDRMQGREVMVIDGLVVLPVGAEIELSRPNVNATVTGVRLLVGTDSRPADVCIDVEVPAAY